MVILLITEAKQSQPSANLQPPTIQLASALANAAQVHVELQPSMAHGQLSAAYNSKKGQQDPYTLANTMWGIFQSISLEYVHAASQWPLISVFGKSRCWCHVETGKLLDACSLQDLGDRYLVACTCKPSLLKFGILCDTICLA